MSFLILAGEIETSNRVGSQSNHRQQEDVQFFHYQLYQSIHCSHRYHSWTQDPRNKLKVGTHPAFPCHI